MYYLYIIYIILNFKFYSNFSLFIKKLNYKNEHIQIFQVYSSSNSHIITLYIYLTVNMRKLYYSLLLNDM